MWTQNKHWICWITELQWYCALWNEENGENELLPKESRVFLPQIPNTIWAIFGVGRGKHMNMLAGKIYFPTTVKWCIQ